MEYKFNQQNFEAEVINSEVPVLVDFYADWCNPCKMMGPVVSKMAEKFEGKLKVGKCNVDDNMALAQKYRVASIPAFAVIDKGEVIASFVGAMSADEFEDKLDAILNK